MDVFGIGATSAKVYVILRDRTTGFEKTGLLWNTAGIFASYTRPGAAPVAITLASQTPTGAWVSGGFVETDAALAPGEYRLDLPDGVCAIGADYAMVHVGVSGVTLMAAVKVILDPYPDVPSGLVATDAGNTALSFKTNLTSSVDNFCKDLFLTFRTGLPNQSKRITAYNGTTKVVTVEGGFTGTPPDNAQFTLVNR